LTSNGKRLDPQADAGTRHVVVAGELANRLGDGGGASVRMTWVAALRRMGFDVWFVEQIERERLRPGPDSPVSLEGSAPVRYFEAITQGCGLGQRAVLLDERGRRLAGGSREELDQVATEAGLLLNVGGHLRLPDLFERFRFRAYLDLEPGFTQCQFAAGFDPGGLKRHNLFFTVGLNVGRTRCDLPTGGIHWRPLPPPVVLDEWQPGGGTLDAFTTVAACRGTSGAVAHRGRIFGSRAHEFRRFLDLPGRLPVAPEIALDESDGDVWDLTALRRNGWRIVDPKRRVPDPERYRDYIRGSGAELSVAEGIHVDTRCGWFSDRTARYLAAGRPALVQSTGIADHVPVGEGLVTFSTPDEAVAGAERIASDYEHHCDRARQVAEEYLDSDRVVGRLCEETGLAP